MKKFLAIALVLCMIFALAACGGSKTEAPKADAPAEEAPAESSANTIYVLGPTPDHGWTAQAGAYAQAKCEEITAAGTYKAV